MRPNEGDVIVQQKGKGVRHWDERLTNSIRLGALHTRPMYFGVLRFVRDHLRRRLVHFELGAHLLDLRCLLFELGNHGLHVAL
jgi:hypothetical protein